MQNEKEAALVLQHQDGQVETGLVSQTAPHLHQKSTTVPMPGQVVHIADLLSHGAENGVPLRHLEKLADLPGREVRRQIERERRAGALIISDNRHGYFLTDDPAEAQWFARSMQYRAREILRTARAIEEAVGLERRL